MPSAPDLEQSPLELAQLRVDGRIEGALRPPRDHATSLGSGHLTYGFGFVGAGVAVGRGVGCGPGGPGGVADGFGFGLPDGEPLGFAA